GTTLGGGTLSLGTTGAIGGGTLALIAGTFQSAVGLTLPNALTFNNSLVTLAGTAPITFGGNATLTNSAGNTNALTVTNPGGVFFTGSFADGAAAGGLVVGGTGTFALTPGSASSYTGGTVLTGGTLILNNTTPLGTGPLTLAGGTLL